MKKLLSLLLAISMVLSMMSITVFATESEDTPVAVAQIGDTTYETLAAAVEAAEAGATVTLLDTATLDKQLVIDKDITITGGLSIRTSVADAIKVTAGTLTLYDVMVSGTDAILWGNGGNIVIANSTVNLVNEDCNNCAVFVDKGTLSVEASVITANNACTTVSVSGSDAALYVYDGGIVSESCTAVVAKNGATVNVLGGEIGTAAKDSYVAMYCVSNGTINIKGGTIVGCVDAEAGTVNISGGTIDSVSEGTGTATITGGTFGSDVSEYCAEGFAVTDDGNGNYTVSEKTSAVAEVNGVKYETLAEAVAVGGEVTLLADVTLTEQLVIDKDVTITGEHTINTSVVDAITVTGGTLTLGEGVTVSGTNAILWGNGGNIVIDGATVELTNAECEYNSVFVSNGSTLTLNSGLISANNGTTVSVSGATLNIHGGKIASTKKSTVVVKDNAVVNMDGGTLTTEDAVEYVVIYSHTGGTINISGGTVEGYAEADSNGFLNISGGYVEKVEGTDGTATITGGSFGEDVSEYCADGYTVAAGEDGKFTVSEKTSAVAEVDGVKYETLAEAVAVGGEVTLLADVTLTEQLVIDKDVTITGDHTINTSVTDAIKVTAGTLTLGGFVYVHGTDAILWGNGGDIVINGAIVEMDNEECDNCAVYVDNGTLTVSAGEIAASNGCTTVSISGSDAALYVYDGQIYSDSRSAVVAKNGATVDVYGGRIATGAADSFVTMYSISGGTINIYDGIVEGYAEADANGILNISGGYVEKVEGTDGTATVTGGTFGEDVSEYCADGFEATLNENGTYTVAEAVPDNSAENPVYVTFGADGTATVTVPAGATYYFATTNNISGMNMTANGAEVEVTYGNMWMGLPSTWTITNSGEEAVEYALKVAYPLGHMMNPEVIESMSWYNDEVVQAEGDDDGYFYTYTAPADGTITLYFSTVYDEETWEAIDFGDQRNILVTNTTNNNVQYSLLEDGVDNYGLELVVPVAANDEIIINTCWTMDAEGNYYPAATYTWNGNFQYPAGSVENPISPEWTWDDEYANATVEVTVPAGETLYFFGNSAMILTVDGVETEQSVDGIFSITNDGETDATYTLALATPVGAYNNPEVIDNIIAFADTKELAADGSYYYIWTAEEDATVVLDVTEGANITVDKLTYSEDSEWPISEQFVLAEPKMGDNYNYIGWIVEENLVIDVKAGQQLKIQVNALTDWETYTTPAVEYTVTGAAMITAEGKCAVGDETVEVTLSLAELNLGNADSIYAKINSDELELESYDWLLEGTMEDGELANETIWANEMDVNVNGDILKLTFKAPAAVGESGFTCDVIVKNDSNVLANVLVDGNVIAEKALFKLYGANMTLGNNLAMNFMVNKTDVDNVEDYYVKITKTYADGRDDVVVESKLTSYNSKLYSVKFDGISAKEMNDKIYVQVFNNDGTPASEVYEDSIVEYAMRGIAKTADSYMRTALVDMLNYGAAAQVEFDYDASNLANSQLTDAQKAHATPSTTVKNYQVKGMNTHGTNLTLKSNLMMNFFFKNVTPDMYAVVTFTKHTGEAKNVRIEGSEFIKYNATIYRVPVSELVIADARQLVTCKVYKADGTLVANATDSVESYVARALEKDGENPLYETIMKFADSAYAYLHNR